MHLRGGIALIKKSMFSYMASRGFFWTLTFGWMMLPLIYMFVWIVAAGEGAISGFTKQDFITYYVFLIFINQLTYPTSHWTVGDQINAGTFSVWLLRPLPPIYEAISTDIAVKVVCLPFVFLFLIVVSLFFKFKLTIDATLVWLFILSLIVAQVLRFMVAYTLAIFALFVEKIHALLRTNDTLIFLLAGQVIPTVLLPDLIKGVSNFLPYRYMLGFPIELILGKLNSNQIITGLALQCIWIVVVILINRVIWKKGIKSYTAVGG